jgi:hypothetical protein
MKFKSRRFWIALAIVTVIMLAVLYGYLAVNRVDMREYMPQIGITHILILVALSLPASYISTYAINRWLGQTKDLIETFKEVMVRIPLYYALFIPMLMIYNFILFGKFFPPYF